MVKKPSKDRKSKALIQASSFQKSVSELRHRRAEIYIRMELQANEPEAIEYYKKAENDLSDVDLDIFSGKINFKGAV